MKFIFNKTVGIARTRLYQLYYTTRNKIKKTSVPTKNDTITFTRRKNTSKKE